MSVRKYSGKWQNVAEHVPVFDEKCYKNCCKMFYLNFVFVCIILSFLIGDHLIGLELSVCREDI